MRPSNYLINLTRFFFARDDGQTPSSVYKSLRKRYAFGAFWSLAGATISRGLAWFAIVICARFLGKVGFGQLGMINSTVGMFSVFAGFGLGITATKYVAEFREKDKSKAGRIIRFSLRVATVTGAIMAILLISLAPVISRKLLAAPDLSSSLTIAAGILFFSAINGAQTGALSGFEAFKTIARVNLRSGFFSFPLIILGVYLLGLKGAVIGMVLSLAINTLLNHSALKSYCHKAAVPLKMTRISSEWPSLWKFALPAYLSSVIVGPVNWVCFSLLANKQGGYAEMGIFNAANQWRIIIEFLPTNLVAIGLPMLTSLYSLGNYKERRRVFSFNIAVTVGTLALAILLSIGIRYQILNAYGPSFKAGSSVFIILMFASIPSAVNNILGQVIVSEGRIWLRFVFDVVLAASMIGLSLYFIPRELARGLALATSLAFMIQTSLMLLWWAIYHRNLNNTNSLLFRFK
jgi:O-antigen/teichoic acid export membrane protein